MDHRWDELLQAEHRRRVEEGRYGARASSVRPIAPDADVERRDRLERERRRVNRSPWQIGASHWDQRDLYTQSDALDETGYARGPSTHPDIGSYAYRRDITPLPHDEDAPSLFRREANPWLNYETRGRIAPRPYEHGGIWDKVKHGVSRVASIVTHDHRGKGPKGYRRSDDAVREDVCEVLAYHPALDASDITVTALHGEVTLEGTVRDRFSKRLAEVLAEHCRGVADVHNRLTIRKDDDDLAFTAPIPSY